MSRAAGHPKASPSQLIRLRFRAPIRREPRGVAIEPFFTARFAAATFRRAATDAPGRLPSSSKLLCVVCVGNGSPTQESRSLVLQPNPYDGMLVGLFRGCQTWNRDRTLVAAEIGCPKAAVLCDC